MPQSLVLHLLNPNVLPFTLSHIAFALPIKKVFKRKISSTGLIIGSMLPDLEYYLRMTMYGTWGHTWKGNLLYEVPLGLVLAFIFHLSIRNQLINHLPDNWFRRVAQYIDYDWVAYFRENWFCVIYSMYLGIATHMLLDIFTHEQGYIFGIGWEIMDTNISGIPLYEWNQMILSILGLGLLYFAFQLKSKTDDLPKRSAPSKMKYWAIFLLLFTFTYILRILVGIPEEKLIIQHMVIFCSASSIALLITSILEKYKKR